MLEHSVPLVPVYPPSSENIFGMRDFEKYMEPALAQYIKERGPDSASASVILSAHIDHALSHEISNHPLPDLSRGVLSLPGAKTRAA